ncbi:hypothetical protein TNCV_3894611 [Trichonephila clavipes]|nr:hypothetical protein TNCV_3894611 [Trichonephila clavipes]
MSFRTLKQGLPTPGLWIKRYRAPVPVYPLERVPRALEGLELLSDINVALFSYTWAFGDGPRNFEPWSSDVDDTRDGTPSPTYHTTPTEGL